MAAKNTKTTVAGIITIIVPVLTVLAAWLTGEVEMSAVVGAAITAVSAGIGLVKAADAKPADTSGK